MRLKNVIVPVVFLACAGCVNQDVVLQKQMELEARLERLIQSDRAQAVRLSEISSDVAEVKGRLKEHDAALNGLKEAERPAPLSGPEAGGRTSIEVINRDAGGRGQKDIVSDEYMKAFGLYGANKYPAAIAAFTAFLKKYPKSEYAPNAQYWIGECYYSQSILPQALEAFETVVREYPHGSKAPDAMLKAGFTLFAMKQRDGATKMLASLVKKFPDSPAAARARERLDRESAGTTIQE